MKLPPSVQREAVDSRLERGAILRIKVLANELGDLNATDRPKYLVILSAECADDPIYTAFTTSKVSNWRTRRDVDHILPLSNGCFRLPTILNVREPQPFGRQVLLDRYADGEVEFVGLLSAEDLVLLDGIIRASRIIPRETKSKILP